MNTWDKSKTSLIAEQLSRCIMRTEVCYFPFCIPLHRYEKIHSPVWPYIPLTLHRQRLLPPSGGGRTLLQTLGYQNTRQTVKRVLHTSCTVKKTKSDTRFYSSKTDDETWTGNCFKSEIWWTSEEHARASTAASPCF